MNALIQPPLSAAPAFGNDARGRARTASEFLADSHSTWHVRPASAGARPGISLARARRAPPEDGATPYERQRRRSNARTNASTDHGDRHHLCGTSQRSSRGRKRIRRLDLILGSYDGTTLVAANDQGHSVLAQFGAATAFKPAALDKYQPQDPYKTACGQAAANYNGALIVATSDGGAALTSAISSLAALGCKAKVVFSAQDPYNPSDPYVPPNPIKAFEPVA